MVINYWFNTSLDQWTKERQQYKDTKKQEAAQRAEAERQAQWNVLFDCAMNSTDTKTIKQYTSASNLNDLAVSIGKWIKETTGKNLKPWLEDNDIVCSYLNKYPERERDVSNYLAWKTTLEEAQNKLGLYRTVPNENQYIESDTGLQKAKRIGVGVAWTVGAIWWADALLYGIGKWSEWAGKTLFWATIQPTAKEAELSSTVLGDQYLLEDRVSEAKDLLNKAKSEWKWVEEAEKALNDAEKALEDYIKNSENKVVKTEWTVFEKVWGDLKRWRTAEWRAAIAQKEMKKIYEDIINPALEKSKSVINLEDIFKEMKSDIQKIEYKWRRDELLEAFDEFSKSVSDKLKLSLKEWDALKKSLWKWTPQKYFNGKDISGVWKQLEADLWTRLKNVFHELLTKEAGVDTAEKYLDWHNRKEYKAAQDKAAQKWILRWTWKDTANVFIEPTSQKAGYWLAKFWEWLQKISKYPFKKALELFKSIKKNPKVLLKWLKAIAPWDLIMPDTKDLLENPWGEKLQERVNKNFGSEIEEQDWYNVANNGDYSSLEEKWWTPEWFEVFINSLE